MTVVGETQQLMQLDDDAIKHEVARGPSLAPNNHIGVRPLLKYDEGLARGSAEIERPYPMMGKFGSYRSGEIGHPLLGATWQVAQMHWTDEQGGNGYLPANTYRRTKALYILHEQNPQLAQDFVRSLEDVFAMPNYTALRVLDRDEEIRRYNGGYADFHPRIRRRCELDPEIVKTQEVDRIIDTLRPGHPDGVRLGEISRLPRLMTQYFLSMYRTAVQKLKQQIKEMQDAMDAGSSGSGSGGTPNYEGQIAAAEAEIAELEPKIKQLEEFQQTLPEWEAKIRQASAERLQQ